MSQNNSQIFGTCQYWWMSRYVEILVGFRLQKSEWIGTGMSYSEVRMQMEKFVGYGMVIVFTHQVLSVIARIVCIDETYANSLLAVQVCINHIKLKLRYCFILENGTDTELFKVSMPFMLINLGNQITAFLAKFSSILSLNLHNIIYLLQLPMIKRRFLRLPSSLHDSYAS